MSHFKGTAGAYMPVQAPGSRRALPTFLYEPYVGYLNYYWAELSRYQPINKVFNCTITLGTSVGTYLGTYIEYVDIADISWVRLRSVQQGSKQST